MNVQSLLKKAPLVVWKQKVEKLNGYKGRKKVTKGYHVLLETNDSEDKDVHIELGQEDIMGSLDDASLIYTVDGDWRGFRCI